MHSLFAYVLYGILLIVLSSCATSASTPSKTSALPASFTTENILSIKEGISSDKILATFGEPKSVSSSVCGGLFGSKRWRCTTWKYGDFPYDRAEFTFREENGSLILNSFSVDRE